MGNAVKGELSIKVGKKAYTVIGDFNALCAFEEETGLRALDFMESFEKGDVSITQMRDFIWACLQEHHPEASKIEAGKVLTKISMTDLFDGILPDADGEGSEDADISGEV